MSALDHMAKLDERNKDAYLRWLSTRYAIAMWSQGWPRLSRRSYAPRIHRAWAAAEMMHKAQKQNTEGNPK